jgi:beta-barrel assembly-enhancing protease
VKQLFLLLATLAADPSLTRLQAEDERVAAISWRMQTANVALCPQKATISGISLHALSQYQPAQRTAATAQFGLTDHVGISAVARGSAADRAGLKVGDALLTIDGQATPTVMQNGGYGPVAHTEAMIEAALVSSSVSLKIQRRGGAHERIELSGDPGCASRVQIVAGSAINAQADGRYVQINAKMLEFVASDDELATIIGHELAHNILRHIADKTPSKQAEYAADRLGVWLMARAGYDVDAVVPFWTRFEKRTNAGIFADGSHPSPKKRIAAVAVAVAEFKAQRAAGQPLLPSPRPRAQ